MGLGGSSAIGFLVLFGGEGSAVAVSCFRTICELLILLKSLRLAPSRTLEGPAAEAIWTLLNMKMTLLKCPQGGAM
jgi:hypothetical protein